MTQPTTVFIGLGTNLGDRVDNLKTAQGHIKRFIDIVSRSSLYETEPVDYEQQGWFLNMVVEGLTRLAARDLLKHLLDTEKEMGRHRVLRKGPRIIDLDILFYGSDIIEQDDLVVPHPEIQNRGFVLTPLNEIAPQFRHPLLQKDVSRLLNELPTAKEVKRLDDLIN